MRHFKSYSPVLIAKHVKAFFKGVFSIQGIGIFRFEFGKVIIKKGQEQAYIKIAKEINSLISAQKTY